MPLTFISPSSITSLGGFLGRRFEANRNGRLKNWALSEQFIQLHEQKNYDGWFWMGEQLGKWLDAAAYTALIAKDTALLERVHALLERLARSQEDDGYLGIAERRYRLPARGMELYEMYYLLHRLLTCADLLDDPSAMETARQLGRFITRTWGPEPGQFPLAGPFPGNGHGGGEGTLILEPIVLLGQRCGDERFVQWGEKVLGMWNAWLEQYPGAIFTCGYRAMQAFAAGELDIFELRPNLHAHTFHMTLLGVAALHNATGKREYRDVVTASLDRLANEWIFLTGGMSSNEHFLPRRYYHPRGDVEVCPQHTWLLLLAQALEWSGEARYAAEIERDLFNQLLAAQLADGSNWNYMTPLNGRAQEPEGPNCCNAAGARILSRTPTYLYGLRDGEPAVLLYTQSEAGLQPPQAPPLKLRQETAFPSQGKVLLHVDPQTPAHFRLHLRLPPYAQGATATVNGEEIFAGETFTAPAGDFLTLERDWQTGDCVTLRLPFRLVSHANASLMAISRGPLVYALFQNAQPDTGQIYNNIGRYPEDVALKIDPARLADQEVEEAAPEGLLGPALRLPGQIRAQAPLFVSADGNRHLQCDQNTPVILLPFANQGALRGDYAVFMQHLVE